MRQKILAGIATGIIVIGAVITPVVPFFVDGFQPNRAYAQVTEDNNKPDPNNVATPDPCGNYGFGCQIMSAVSEAITFFPFLMATMAGLVFDYSIWYSIQSGTYTAYDGDTSEEGFVIKGWKLVRDFSNLLFIFALFMVAFALILGLDSGENGGPMGLDPKRTIVRVIIMALLVNFSFFLGRMTIDITNLIALSFYNNMTSSPLVKEVNTSVTGAATIKDANEDVTKFYATTNAVGIRSVSVSIISKINPQEFILSKAGGTATPKTGSYGALFFVAIMSAAFSLFLVYIFLSIAILFIARTIGLFLGIILSPIAFVSYVIPALRKKSYIGLDDWMQQFLGLAFMAPIFIFFLYIAAQFFEISMGNGGGIVSISAQVLFKFAVIGFLLIYGKKISKELSGKLGEMATGVIKGAIGAGAMIATAGAAGGAGAAFRMGGRIAANKARSVAVGAGTSVLGRERVEAIQQRMAGGLRGFSPRRTLIGTAGLLTGGSKFPGQLDSTIKQGQRFGSRYKSGNYKIIEDRAKNFQKIRADKQKSVARVDEQIGELRKKMETATDGEKILLTSQIKDLEKQKRDIITPPIPATTNPNVAKAEATKATNSSTNEPANPETKTPEMMATPVRPLSIGTEGVVPQTVSSESDIWANRPKNNFNGDVKFDRPEESSRQEYELNKRIERSQRDTNLGNVTAEELTVKKINIENPESLPIGVPTTGPAASRTSALLTGIGSGGKLAPASNTRPVGVLGYSVNTFKPKSAVGVPVPDQDRTGPTKDLPATPTNTPRTFGDGSAKKPEYTPVQQERILNKAIAAEEKSKQQRATQEVAQKEPEETYEDMFNRFAQITPQQSKIVTTPVLQQRTDIDHSGIVRENIGGDNGLDFGGIQLPKQES